MKKEKSYFVCQECGYSSPKWMGKCPSCGAWNSMVEEKNLPKTSSLATPYKPPQPVLSWVEDLPTRLTTGFSNLDEALGGGIVKGPGGPFGWRAWHRQVYLTFTAFR